MPVGIGSNPYSLLVQRQLNQSSRRLADTTQQLASGMRINKASDDAAGLAVATTLSARSRVFAQGIRNINDGVSALNVTEGALSSLEDITIRQRELAMEAANGSFSAAQRRALDKEANALSSEFNRIVQTTTFNGVRTLDLSASNLNLQAGFSAAGAYQFNIGNQLSRAAGTGSFATAVSFDSSTFGYYPIDFGDIDGDGKMDALVNYYSGEALIQYGNGDGTFRAPGSNMTAVYGNAKLVDLNGDGRADLVGQSGSTIKVAYSDGSGFSSPVTLTESFAATNLQASDLNGDGRQDLIAYDASGHLQTFQNNGSSFSASGVSSSPTGFVFGDMNGDGLQDLVSVQITGAGPFTANVKVQYGSGSGTFGAMTTIASFAWTSGAAGFNPTFHVTDFDHDGFGDVIMMNGGDHVSVLRGTGSSLAAPTSVQFGTSFFGAVTKMGDLNNDGIDDLLVGPSDSGSGCIAMFGNADGSFSQGGLIGTQLVSSLAYVSLRDMNADGVLDILDVTSPQNYPTNIAFANTTHVTTVARMNLFTQGSGRDALELLSAQQNRIVSELANIGVARSRLDSGLSSLSSMTLGLDSAASRIMDVDVASASAESTRQQILQSAGAAVLAQANVAPKLALKLLTG